MSNRADPTLTPKRSRAKSLVPSTPEEDSPLPTQESQSRTPTSKRPRELTLTEILSKLLPKKQLDQGSRYFLGDPMKKIVCHNCKKLGHFMRDCPNSTMNTCFVCGSRDHSSWKCPNDPCDLCLEVGHDASECTSKNPRGVTLCTYCGNHNHVTVNCNGLSGGGKEEVGTCNPDLKCMICFEKGHINCAGPSKVKSVTWCCQCGSNNHTKSFCRNLQMQPEDISLGLHGGRAHRQFKTCYHCASLRHIARDCPFAPPRSRRWTSYRSCRNGPDMRASWGSSKSR